MKDFSAVAYFFGRNIQDKVSVPIGLIHTSWGGTPIETWIAQELIQEDKELKDAASKITQKAWWPSDAGLAYNAMIYPIANFNVAGCIWYQGESNVENAASYYQYALYAINFGSRLTGHPDITVKYVEAVSAFEDGEYRTAYRGFSEIFEEIDFIFQTVNIEIEKGVCLALLAGEYHSTVDAIIDANDLANSMVTTAKQTLIIPTIAE